MALELDTDLLSELSFDEPTDSETIQDGTLTPDDFEMPVVYSDLSTLNSNIRDLLNIEPEMAPPIRDKHCSQSQITSENATRAQDTPRTLVSKALTETNHVNHSLKSGTDSLLQELGNELNKNSLSICPILMMLDIMTRRPRFSDLLKELIYSQESPHTVSSFTEHFAKSKILETKTPTKTKPSLKTQLVSDFAELLTSTHTPGALLRWLTPGRNLTDIHPKSECYLHVLKGTQNSPLDTHKCLGPTLVQLSSQNATLHGTLFNTFPATVLTYSKMSPRQTKSLRLSHPQLQSIFDELQRPKTHPHPKGIATDQTEATTSRMNKRIGTPTLNQIEQVLLTTRLNLTLDSLEELSFFKLTSTTLKSSLRRSFGQLDRHFPNWKENNFELTSDSLNHLLQVTGIRIENKELPLTLLTFNSTLLKTRENISPLTGGPL